VVRQFDGACKDREWCTAEFDYAGLDAECNKELKKRANAAKSDYLAKKLKTPAKDYKRDDNVPAPLLYVIAECDNQNIQVSGFDVEMSRQGLAGFLVGMDVLIFTVFIIGYNVIYRMAKDYAQQFDESQAEARDFTLKIEKLPSTFSQYTDDIGLKRAIWQQIQQAIQESIDQRLCNSNIDKSIVAINLTKKDKSMLNVQKQMKKEMHGFVKEHAVILNTEHSR